MHSGTLNLKTPPNQTEPCDPEKPFNDLSSRTPQRPTLLYSPLPQNLTSKSVTSITTMSCTVDPRILNSLPMLSSPMPWAKRTIGAVPYQFSPPSPKPETPNLKT